MKGSLESRQQAALEVWLENPLIPLDEVADKAGIGKKTFWRYRQDAQFMEQYRNRCRERFAALENKAVTLLDVEMDKGNWNAIKYTLDGLGYKPTDKQEIKHEGLTIMVDYGENTEGVIHEGTGKDCD